MCGRGRWGSIFHLWHLQVDKMNNEFKELKRTAKLQQQRYGAGSNALLFSGGVSLFC